MISKLLFILIFSVLTVPGSAQAVDIRQRFFFQSPGAVWAGDDLGALISGLIINSIIIAGVFFFFLIVYSGFLLISYGGQNNPPARVAQSKAMITYGAIGFLLVVSAYFILQLVSTITGVNFMNADVT